MREKNENKFIQNAILIGIGIFGLKYIIPGIKLPNIKLPDYPDFNSSNNNYNDIYASNYMQSTNSSDSNYNDNRKTYPEKDHIIDYSPPIEEDPNPEDDGNDDGKINPVDKIIDYSPPIEKVNPSIQTYSTKGSPEIDPGIYEPPAGASTYPTKGSPELDPDPFIPPGSGDTLPIREKIEPIESKTSLISSMKGVFFNMFNELMLGDRTWYFSQQDIINMERLHPKRVNMQNPSCSKFVKSTPRVNQLPNKEIFY